MSEMTHSRRSLIKWQPRAFPTNLEQCQDEWNLFADKLQRAIRATVCAKCKFARENVKMVYFESEIEQKCLKMSLVAAISTSFARFSLAFCCWCCLSECPMPVGWHSACQCQMDKLPFLFGFDVPCSHGRGRKGTDQLHLVIYCIYSAACKHCQLHRS